MEGIEKILKTHPEYKVVYFNILDAGAVFTIIVPWLMKRKIVVHSHNGSTEKTRLHYLCRPFLYALTDEYIACSKVAAEFMFGAKKNVLVVPNAINIEKYIFSSEIRKMRKHLNVENKFVVCHVGRLSEQKNPLRVLDIFKSILKKREDAVLLSVGTGELEMEVKKHASDLKISNSVFFLGVRNDINNILQAADVFILPSLYEGLPMVAIEAQASGVPCILSDKISTEVNVTGNVQFKSLLCSDDDWADVVLAVSTYRKKNDKVFCLSEAGYDNRYFSEPMKKLMHILRG